MSLQGVGGHGPHVAAQRGANPEQLHLLPSLLPSPGMALSTEGSTEGELVWGVSPHLNASFQALPLPTHAQLLWGSSNVLSHASNGSAGRGLGLEQGPSTPPPSDTQCRERAFSQGRARHGSTGLLLP